MQGYIRYLRDRSLEVGVVSINVARQRKTAAEAELAEIELAKARADVLGIEDVAKQWDAILTGVRTRLLAMPTKVAPMVTPSRSQKREQQPFTIVNVYSLRHLLSEAQVELRQPTKRQTSVDTLRRAQTAARKTH